MELTQEQLDQAKELLLKEQKQEELKQKECLDKIMAILKEYGYDFDIKTQVTLGLKNGM